MPGWLMSSLATPARLRWPPESAPMRVSACSVRPTSSMTRATAASWSAFGVSCGRRSSAA